MTGPSTPERATTTVRRGSNPDRPMQQRAAATRAALIDGAAHIVATDGAAGTINTMIVAAGVTKGAAYFHFDTKDDLLDAISDEALHRCRFVTDHHPRSGTDRASAADAVRAVVTEYVQTAAADEVVRADAVLWCDPTHADYARAGVHRLLHTTLVDLLAAHPNADTDAAVVTADVVLAMLTGLGARSGSGHGFTAPDTERTVTRMLDLALTATGEPSTTTDSRRRRPKVTVAG